VLEVLKLKIVNLPDGQLEVKAPHFVRKIDPKQLKVDPQLGLVFSIQDLATLFEVKAKFNIVDYAIDIEVPWKEERRQISQVETPIILDGLPRLHSPKMTMTAVEQQVNITGGGRVNNNYSGNFSAVGTLFGGSWFTRLNQPNLSDRRSWSLSQAQYLRQTSASDYILGSQSPFWRSQGTGDYWGFTTIQRYGYKAIPTPGGDSSPQQRLQAANFGQTISGEAAPGTLVRLVQGGTNYPVGEVLVDSSGIYRFENVKGYNYRLLLYPEGRLTAQPEIRDVTLGNTIGQIPRGSSALLLSGGFRRVLSSNVGFFGEFTDFRGGIAQRWGISDELTVGLGGVYDESLRGTGEVFFRSKNFPIEAAVSFLTGNTWDVNARVRYQPSRNFNLNFLSDRFSNRLDMNWQLSRSFALLGSYDSNEGTTAIGGQLNLQNRNGYTFARATLDNESRLRWILLQRLGKFELSQQGNEVRTFTELSYRFSDEDLFNSGHSLVLNYETANLQNSNNLAFLGWRYLSPQRSSDGNFALETQLGYGIGSQGSGLYASVGTKLIPGLQIRARYQGVSVTSDESSFSIQLIPSFNLQNGISPNERHTNLLRTSGGLWIQPFLDNNNNGKQDRDESAYTENMDLLVTLNNQSLKSFTSEIQGNKALVYLSPGTYRLDFDPAGFPVDRQASIDSLAVDVTAGSFTPIPVPFIRSYTRTGVITNNDGNPVAGVQIEVIPQNIQKRKFAVTNSAGVYYLEGLQQGEYQVIINGKSSGLFKLEAASAAFAELNFQQEL
jgi:Carboxypeptidase regulatory-like domain